MIRVFTDGGARGNPGPAAIGVVIENENKALLAGFGKPIGETTNNVAEYQAVIAALEWLHTHRDIVKNEKIIFFFVDSLLIYSQITGVYKIKNATLFKLVQQVKELEKNIPIHISYAHIPRKLNKKADMFVNLALDKRSFVTYNNREPQI